MSSDILLRFAFAIGIIFLGVGVNWLFNRRLISRAKGGIGSLFNTLPNKPTIIYFTTPDCAPCKTVQRPALEKAAEAAGKGEALHERLQNAYWLEGKDISDPAVLGALWESAGLPQADIGAVLADPAWREAVDADIALAQDYNLSGVPALVLNDQYLVVGAQPYAYLKQAIEQVASESGPTDR